MKKKAKNQKIQSVDASMKYKNKNQQVLGWVNAGYIFRAEECDGMTSHLICYTQK